MENYKLAIVIASITRAIDASKSTVFIKAMIAIKNIFEAPNKVFLETQTILVRKIEAAYKVLSSKDKSLLPFEAVQNFEHFIPLLPDEADKQLVRDVIALRKTVAVLKVKKHEITEAYADTLLATDKLSGSDIDTLFAVLDIKQG